MAEFSPEKAFNYLKKLSFERKSGSQEEKKAAKIISSEMKKLGLKPRQEKFEVESFTVGTASLTVTSPFRKKYNAWPLGYSVSTPPSGINAPIAYVDPLTQASIKAQKGKIILTEGAPNAKLYKVLKDSGIKAIIRICPLGKNIYNKFFHGLPKKLGRIRGVSIKYEHGLEIIKRGAKKIRLISKTTNRKSSSQNVALEIKGTTLPEEIILVGGHYDSVPWSMGVMDNAAGSAMMMALAAYFVKKPLARTLRFVWFGCEEVGLVGSFEYAKKHKKRLKNIKLMLNLDVGGSLIGRINAYATGSKKLATYAQVMGMETGAFRNVAETAVPSDATPLAEQGIEALSLTRSGSSGGQIHTSGDTIEHCGPEAFDLIGKYAIEFLRRVGNAVEFPFEDGLSDNVKSSMKKFMENIGRTYE
jgi:hypothetical protein